MTSRILQVSIHDFWHSGSGRGAGSLVDALVERGADGLPYLPGRSLKGLLRDAMGLLERVGDVGPGSVARLFGQAATGDGATRHDSQPGLLAFSDARLPHSVAAWLASKDGQALRAQLFRNLYSTAMDPVRGTAKEKSLRGMEVVVPIELECEVSGPSEGVWVSEIGRALPFVRAIGGHRQRGLGRCALSWKEGA